jgi:hypothetical protein
VAEGLRQLIERYVTREVLELRLHHDDEVPAAKAAGPDSGDAAQLEDSMAEHVTSRSHPLTADSDATAAASRGAAPGQRQRRATLGRLLRLTGRSLVDGRPGLRLVRPAARAEHNLLPSGATGGAAASGLSHRSCT